ncbi:MAG: hypothetical protein JNL61_03755 [Rhizobiaceae bacterium]|nr:hypothetical protein [Rhizobiaceae bacterium]
MIRRIALLLFAVIAVVLLLRWLVSADGIWDAMKPALIPVVRVYLDIFNSPATAILLCVVMLLVAIGLFAAYHLRQIAPAERDLSILATQLRAIDRRSVRDSTLAEIDRAMQRYPRFDRGWRLYRATLVAGADGRWFSSLPPSHYFNMRMLENSGMRLRFYLGLPNDFVGLGLVFTFLGLVAGLYFASRSMMASDLSDARAALTQLLHAATFKFLTSIVGISISIVMSAAQRVQLERLHGALAEVQMLLEEALPLARGREAGSHPAPVASVPSGA